MNIGQLLMYCSNREKIDAHFTQKAQTKPCEVKTRWMTENTGERGGGGGEGGENNGNVNVFQPPQGYIVLPARKKL